MSDKTRTTQEVIDDLRRFIGGMQYTGDGTSDDIGAAADYLEEAADRLEELQSQIKPPQAQIKPNCVWREYINGNGLHDTACGDSQFYDAGVDKRCPNCGGKITFKRKSGSKS